VAALVVGFSTSHRGDRIGPGIEAGPVPNRSGPSSGATPPAVSRSRRICSRTRRRAGYSPAVSPSSSTS
jgi:hypothetical protein